MWIGGSPTEIRETMKKNSWLPTKHDSPASGDQCHKLFVEVDSWDQIKHVHSTARDTKGRRVYTNTGSVFRIVDSIFMENKIFYKLNNDEWTSEKFVVSCKFPFSKM